MWAAWALVAWYGGCFYWVARTAIRATLHEGPVGCVLVLGRRSPGGMVHPHFMSRLSRAQQMLKDGSESTWILSGGAPVGEPSEASLARAWIQFPSSCRIEMEEKSSSTWGNLRNSATIIKRLGFSGEPVAVITSRYHLARCSAIARAAGVPLVLCPAEERLEIGLSSLLLISREAIYLMPWQLVAHLAVISRPRHPEIEHEEENGAPPDSHSKPSPPPPRR